MGMLDRQSRKVRASVIPNVKRDTLQAKILNGIEHGSKFYTDTAVAYDKLAQTYAHEMVNHLEGYVQGRVHTNGLENFWSLLKRSLNGSYVWSFLYNLPNQTFEAISYPGGDFTYPTAINNSGTVAGLFMSGGGYFGFALVGSHYRQILPLVRFRQPWTELVPRGNLPAISRRTSN